MQKKHQDFIDAFGVSYETIHRLEIYEKRLIEWNGKFNLIAASTESNIWMRHFFDSAQLFSLLPQKSLVLADMGAGAGFPGLVLAIMSREKMPELQIFEIESTNKKADFLQAIAEELELKVTVKRERIENIRDLKADVITARALKDLPELLKYANYLTNKDSLCLFLKGKSLDEELTEGRKYWTFSIEIHPSRSDNSGSILAISNLRYKTRR